MTGSPAPLLSSTVVDQIKRIAAGIRNGEVAPLVGAGTSVRAGLPGWDELVRRMILAWQRWDRPELRRLPENTYVQLTRGALDQNQLAIAAYLRKKVSLGASQSLTGFGQLLYGALYSRPYGNGELFTPVPDHVHRYLVELFGRSLRRLWTTNYDDLLEEAARLNGLSTRVLDPDRRQVNSDLLISHVHGFLAPPIRIGGNPDPQHATVVLAEDDYHAVAADVIGWTNRELHGLFDGYRALIIGMSLTDPNLRRVLATLSDPVFTGTPRHFAVLRTIDGGELGLVGTRRASRPIYAQMAAQMRRSYWEQRGIEVVEIDDYDAILPFLVRLRYEYFGEKSGDLWRRASAVGYQAVDPWNTSRQEVAHGYLATEKHKLVQDFAVADGSEIVEIGVFLLQPDGETLELVFRGGGPWNAVHGGRTLSGNPDSPTGVAGRVFVSGDLVRVARNHGLYDYGLTEVLDSPSNQIVAGIISAPIVDWKDEGTPLGVVYVTTTTTEGTLFKLRPRTEVEVGQLSLHDLYEWLSDAALNLISSFKS